MCSILLDEFPSNALRGDIAVQDAVKSIQQDCLQCYTDLRGKVQWIETLDEVTVFAVVAMAWQLGADRLLTSKSGFEYLKKGSFNLAALEFNRLKVNRRFTTILRLGRLS